MQMWWTLQKSNIITAFQTRNERSNWRRTLQGKLLRCISWRSTLYNRLRKPCTTEIAECLLHDKSVKKNNGMTVLLSNDTGTPQMKHLVTNVKTELISQLQNCTFALLLDPSTDETELCLFSMRWLLCADTDWRTSFCMWMQIINTVT